MDSCRFHLVLDVLLNFDNDTTRKFLRCIRSGFFALSLASKQCHIQLGKVYTAWCKEMNAIWNPWHRDFELCCRDYENALSYGVDLSARVILDVMATDPRNCKSFIQEIVSYRSLHKVNPEMLLLYAQRTKDAELFTRIVYTFSRFRFNEIIILAETWFMFQWPEPDEGIFSVHSVMLELTTMMTLPDKLRCIREYYRRLCLIPNNCAKRIAYNVRTYNFGIVAIFSRDGGSDIFHPRGSNRGYKGGIFFEVCGDLRLSVSETVTRKIEQELTESEVSRPPDSLNDSCQFGMEGCANKFAFTSLIECLETEVARAQES